VGKRTFLPSSLLSLYGAPSTKKKKEKGGSPHERKVFSVLPLWFSANCRSSLHEVIGEKGEKKRESRISIPSRVKREMWRGKGDDAPSHFLKPNSLTKKKGKEEKEKEKEEEKKNSSIPFPP